MAQAVTVAPVVTTSSTSTTGVPAGGRPARRGSTRPARLACRAAAPRPTESRTPEATRNAGATAAAAPAPASTAAARCASEPHVLAAAPSSRRPSRRHRHQAHLLAPFWGQTEEMNQGGRERAAQWSRKVASARSL